MQNLILLALERVTFVMKAGKVDKNTWRQK